MHDHSRQPIVAIIQARLSSTRLAQKVLLPLGNSSVIEEVVRRVGKAKHISKVVVSISDQATNKPLVEFLKQKNIPFHLVATAEDDVLDRYYQTAQFLQATHICRVTADCPLIDPQLIDQVLESYLNSDDDYVSNNHPQASFPDGMDTEVFSFTALEKTHREAKLKSEREHVTPYIWKHPEIFSISTVSSPKDFSSYRITLDEPSDYQVIQEIYSEQPNATMSDIIWFLDHHPSVRKTNQSILRDEGYAKSLADD